MRHALQRPSAAGCVACSWAVLHSPATPAHGACTCLCAILSSGRRQQHHFKHRSRRQGRLYARDQPLLTAGSVAPAAAAHDTTFIPFEGLQKGPPYDLRFYEPRYVVETAYERRDEGFIALGNYLAGENEAGVRMEATQPVVMRYDPSGAKRMQLYVIPTSTHQRENAPLEQPPFPVDTNITLQIAGGEVVAVLKFSGYATKEICSDSCRALRDQLQADGVALAEDAASGAFRLAQYGPLHSLSERVNEIWLGVQL